MNKEEILELLDNTIHWFKALGLKEIEKEIVESRGALEIEHYHDTITYSVKKTDEYIKKLEVLREQIAKEIRDEMLEEFKNR